MPPPKRYVVALSESSDDEVDDLTDPSNSGFVDASTTQFVPPPGKRGRSREIPIVISSDSEGDLEGDSEGDSEGGFDDPTLSHKKKRPRRVGDSEDGAYYVDDRKNHTIHCKGGFPFIPSEEGDEGMAVHSWPSLCLGCGQYKSNHPDGPPTIQRPITGGPNGYTDLRHEFQTLLEEEEEGVLLDAIHNAVDKILNDPLSTLDVHTPEGLFARITAMWPGRFDHSHSEEEIKQLIEAARRIKLH